MESAWWLCVLASFVAADPPNCSEPKSIWQSNGSESIWVRNNVKHYDEMLAKEIESKNDLTKELENFRNTLREKCTGGDEKKSWCWTAEGYTGEFQYKFAGKSSQCPQEYLEEKHLLDDGLGSFATRGSVQDFVSDCVNRAGCCSFTACLPLRDARLGAHRLFPDAPAALTDLGLSSGRLCCETFGPGKGEDCWVTFFAASLLGVSISVWLVLAVCLCVVAAGLALIIAIIQVFVVDRRLRQIPDFIEMLKLSFEEGNRELDDAILYRWAQRVSGVKVKEALVEAFNSMWEELNRLPAINREDLQAFNVFEWQQLDYKRKKKQYRHVNLQLFMSYTQLAAVDVDLGDLYYADAKDPGYDTIDPNEDPKVKTPNTGSGSPEGTHGLDKADKADAAASEVFQWSEFRLPGDTATQQPTATTTPGPTHENQTTEKKVETKGSIDTNSLDHIRFTPVHSEPEE